MYLVRSLRTFIGTNAERIAAGLESFLPGDEYIETDTSLVYIHNGMTWLLNSSAGSPGGSDTQIQFNDDGVFGASANLAFNPTTNQMLVGGAIAADSTAVLEAHDSITDMRFNVVNDSASNSANLANVGFYLKNDAEEFTLSAFWTAGLADRTDGSEDSYLIVGLIRNGLNAITTYFGASQTYFNYNSDNIDTIIYGASESFTTMVDAGENAFQVGFLTPGNIVDFRYAGIVFNNGENDIDLRIAGDGVTNGVYWDASNSRLGLGTNAPDQLLHVAGNTTIVGYLNVNTTNNPPAGNLGVIHCYGVAPGFFFYEQGTTDNNVFFVYDGGLMQFQNRTDAGGFTSSPFVFDMTSATNTFRVNSSRVGIGTDPTNVSAKLEISSTTGALLLPRMTTTQRNALTAVNGMIIYNSTNNVIEGYENGSWVNL